MNIIILATENDSSKKNYKNVKEQPSRTDEMTTLDVRQNMM